MSSTLCDTCNKDSRYMAAVAENAKLRELVRDMWRSHIWYSHDQAYLCEGCQHFEECVDDVLDGTCPMCDPYLKRMQELGIEVD